MAKQRPGKQLVLLLLLVLAMVPLVWFWAWHGKLHVENFAKLRVGMTQAEVEDLLGGPPGDYDWRFWGATDMTTEGTYDPPPGGKELQWADGSHRFEIAFDAQGRVAHFHQRSGYRRSWLPW